MKKISLCLFGLAALAGNFTLRAQSPGGVPVDAWYRTDVPAALFSDAGITPATDNQPVHQWNESQSTGYNLIQTSAARQPVFSNQSNLANFNPSVTFDGSNDWMAYTAPAGVNIIDRENGTIYAAGYMETQSRSGFVGFHATMDYPGLHFFSDDKLLFFTGGPGYQGLSADPVAPRSAFTAGTGWQNGAGSTASYAAATVSLNGTHMNYTGTQLYNANLSTGARDLRIGADNNYGAFGGQLNEILVFEERLTTTQMDQVESYLALKYGNTFAGGTRDYLNSTGNPVWSAAANAGYNQHIAGIGRDDNGALYQKQSWSTNDGKQVLIGLGSLANTNAGNTGTLTNGQYLIWGDNGARKAPTEPISGVTGVNHHFAAIWKVENTGAVGTVRIAWPKTFSSLTLIQSSDATIDGSDAATDMSANETTINGVVYNYADVSLADGTYFTFAAFVHAPGGVTAGLTQWYRADKNVIASGGAGTPVEAWTDYVSGVTAAPVSGQPVPNYVDGAADYFNFNPGIHFTATNQKLVNLQEGALLSTDFDIFTLTKEGMTGTRYFNIGRDNTTFSGSNWDQPGLYVNGNVASRNNTGGGLVITNPGNIDFEEAIPSIMYYSFSDTEFKKGLNGALSGTPYSFSSRGLMTGGVIFGANTGAGTSGDDGGFTGNIGEVIVYGDGSLTAAERNKVEAYLAIKYGLTLDSSLNYLSSADLVVWDAEADSAYYHNVAGIARDVLSDLDQKQSKSVNGGQQLLIGTPGLDSTNAANATSLADGQYLVWGDNGGAKVPAVAIAGLGSVNFRFAAVWKVRNTGNVGTVRVTWPAGLTNLSVLQSVDPMFGTGVTVTDMTANVITLEGLPYNYADVTLADGSFFTFAGQLNGPGGVAADLRVWLRSDAGFNPDSWTDFSGNDNHYTQTNASRQPFLASDLYNFNPIVDFGTTGAAARFMVVPDGKPFTANGTDATFFTASLSRDASGYSDILGFGNTTTGTGLIQANDPVITKLNSRIVLYPYTTANSLPEVERNRLELDDISFTTGTAGLKYGKNGETDELNITVTASNVDVADGSVLGSQGETRNGLIGEVIAYERDLSEAEKQRVRTYVGIKYGLTLKHHYIASDGSIVWDTLLNEGFNNHIAGIARDDEGSLYQKQSQSVDRGRQVLISTTGLAASNAINSGNLSNGQFLIWGDNGAAKSPAIPIAGIADVNHRFASIWKVQNTDAVGTVRIAWPKGLANLKLIRSADTVFDATDAITDLHQSVLIDGTEYAFADVSLTDASYFTFAAYVQAPGGVAAGLLMWHRADDGTVSAGSKDVWSDVSGNGRDVTQLNDTAYQPLLVTDSAFAANTKDYFFNYNPFYYYDGTNDFFYNTDEVYFPSNTSAGTTYGVLFNSNAGGYNTAFGWGDDDPNFVRAGNEYQLWRNNGLPLAENVGLNSRPAHIGSMGWRGAVNGLYLHVNGALADSSGTANIGTIQDPVSNINFAIGSEGVDLAGNGNEVYQGGMAEVFAYSVDHQNSTGDEKARINSYLAIKYGITLRNDADTANPDYLSSASVVLYASDSVFDHNIAGVGKDFPSGLNQKQSRSVNANPNDQVVMGVSSIASTNAANPSQLNDNSYLIWGDNGRTESLSDAYTAFTYAGSADNGRRMNRVWKVQNTGITQDMLIRFPVASVGTTVLADEACADYVMLMAEDPEFTSGLRILRPDVMESDYVASHAFPSGVHYFTYARITPVSPGVAYLPSSQETTVEFDTVCTSGDWTYFHKAGDEGQNMLGTSGFTNAELGAMELVVTTEGVSFEDAGLGRTTNLMPRITTVNDGSANYTGLKKVRVFYSQAELDASLVAGALTSGWFLYEGDGNEVLMDIYNDGIFDQPKASALVPAAFGVEDGVNYVEFENITSLASIVFISSTEELGVVLPVSLLYFSATAQDQTAVLEWATASEKNNKGFFIEQSADGRDWKEVGFADSKGADGNSVAQLDYRFVDKTPLAGTNFYRLKQVDFQGTFTYSAVRTVRFGEQAGTTLSPNPTRDVIRLERLPAGSNQILVINSIGQVMQNLDVQNTAAYTLDLKGYIAGVYYISVRNENGTTQHFKVVKE